jgi:hypothetical protein
MAQKNNIKVTYAESKEVYDTSVRRFISILFYSLLYTSAITAFIVDFKICKT